MVKQRDSTPNDAAFKGFMSKVDNARDFFDIHLPPILSNYAISTH